MGCEYLKKMASGYCQNDKTLPLSGNTRNKKDLGNFLPYGTPGTIQNSIFSPSDVSINGKLGQCCFYLTLALCVFFALKNFSIITCLGPEKLAVLFFNQNSRKNTKC